MYVVSDLNMNSLIRVDKKAEWLEWIKKQMNKNGRKYRHESPHWGIQRKNTGGKHNGSLLGNVECLLELCEF